MYLDSAGLIILNTNIMSLVSYACYQKWNYLGSNQQSVEGTTVHNIDGIGIYMDLSSYVLSSNL